MVQKDMEESTECHRYECSLSYFLHPTPAALLADVGPIVETDDCDVVWCNRTVQIVCVVGMTREAGLNSY